MRKELDQIKELQLEKHLKFFMLRICYSGKVTHLLRSLSPVLTYNFCRSFNKIRTDFLAFLLSVDAAALNNHIFISVVLVSLRLNGGPNLLSLVVVRILSLSSVDVTQVKKIFLFRQVVFFLVYLRSELSLISPDLWQTCFPADIC
ncbi:hypothetical protein GEMRC1_011760 [Eukaryota sp. GEM-RC1]